MGDNKTDLTSWDINAYREYTESPRFKELENMMRRNHKFYFCHLDEPFGFGKKHKYNSLRTVILKDPGYIDWALSERAIALSDVLDHVFKRMKELPYAKREGFLHFATIKLGEIDEKRRVLLLVNIIKNENHQKMVSDWRDGQKLIDWLYEKTISQEINWEPVRIQIGCNGVLNGTYKGHRLRVERSGVGIDEGELWRYRTKKGLSFYVDDILCSLLEGYDWIPVWNKITEEVNPYRIRERIVDKEPHDLPFMKKLEIVDVLVQSYDFKCEKNHTVEDVLVIVPVCDKEGNRTNIEVPAGYCMDCEHFFILKSIFYDILSYGKPLCRIYENIEQARQSKHTKLMGLAEESPLHIYGYDVNKQSDLSRAQRWAILETVIDLNVLTKEKVISYLDWFCDTRKSIPQMAEAVKKWSEDRMYVIEYEGGTGRTVVARSISLVSRKK